MLKIKKTFFLVLLAMSTQLVISQEQKIIQGKVTYKDQPLLNSHVLNLSSKAYVKTNSKGEYQIKAKVGEELSFSYVGLETMKVIVEDVTTTLNIRMIEKVNELETVVVKSNKKRGKSQEIVSKKLAKIPTAFGELDLKKFGSKVDYVSGKDLNEAAAVYTVAPAIANKVVNAYSSPDGQDGMIVIGRGGISGDLARWDIDGAIMDAAPYWLKASDIEDVYVLKNAPARYGHKSVIVVITKNNPALYAQKKKAQSDQYKNQNFYDETSVAQKLDASQNDLPVNTGEEKEIFGKLTYLDAAVPNVLVSVAGKKEVKTYSDVEGLYRLKVQVGDIVQFSHVSFETTSIFIEDVTQELNLELRDKRINLDEVAVKSVKTTSEVLRKKSLREEKFTTSRGEFDPKKSGFSLKYAEGKNVSNMYENIQQAVVAKIPGLIYDKENGNVYSQRAINMSISQDMPMVWEIDGLLTSNPPPLDLSQIKSIRAMTAMGSTNRYGSQAVGGVIIIETTYGNFQSSQNKKGSFLEEYANSNFYGDDASLSSLEVKEQNKYVQSVSGYKNKYKAFEFYQNELKAKMTNYGDHLSVAMQFIEKYNDEAVANKIFEEVANANAKNPEVLKSIAYYYQLLDNKRGAIDMYERVFKLRPHYAQSFRDLANAYADYDLYNKAWKLYWAYMIKGKVASEEGIGELMYSDMEWLHYHRANQMNFKRNFVPIHKNAKEFKRDVRMVFEWNTSEAEFELEFVSPDRRVYTFDHSLAANNDLIINEKKVGYSSKMFVIEDLGEGDWLVNISYKGNKKTTPTFLKLTTYFNWGKPNEKRDVNVYKLDIQNQKASLLKFDREFEVFQKIAKN